MTKIEQILDTNYQNNLSLNEINNLKNIVIQEIHTIKNSYDIYENALNLDTSKLTKKMFLKMKLIMLFSFLIFSFISYLFLPFPKDFSFDTSFVLILSLCLISILFLSFTISLTFMFFQHTDNPKLKYITEKNFTNPLMASFEYVKLQKEVQNNDDVINNNLIIALILKNQSFKLFSKYL